ncbi:hypothetical protein OIU78_012385 [Salix suchowensis]|nr:hypothetical protein OIU78_012385 [Salix suchowensis]
MQRFQARKLPAARREKSGRREELVRLLVQTVRTKLARKHTAHGPGLHDNEGGRRLDRHVSTTMFTRLMPKRTVVGKVQRGILLPERHSNAQSDYLSHML